MKEIDKASMNVDTKEIVGTDDTIPAGWFEKGMKAAEAVAHLTVTRYIGGRIDRSPVTRDPIKQCGTGWLIGKRHIITNHHVINFRLEGEDCATESDLVLQAKGTVVRFGYDSKGSKGLEVGIQELATWKSYDKKSESDFAILKLKEPLERQPLALAPKWLDTKIGGLPVNIIHHPNGNPKMVSCRNNLISAIERNVVRYYTDTTTGSSGAPVFNDDWKVVALHMDSRELEKPLNFQGKLTKYVNVGLRIDRIIECIRGNCGSLWETIGAEVE